jgi:hypothetical protein
MRLSPQDPQISGMHVAAAFAHFVAGHFEEALAEAEAAVRGQFNFFVGTCVAAASAAMAGKAAQAEAAMARARELNPACACRTSGSWFRFGGKKISTGGRRASGKPGCRIEHCASA